MTALPYRSIYLLPLASLGRVRVVRRSTIAAPIYAAMAFGALPIRATNVDVVLVCNNALPHLETPERDR